MSPTVVNPQAGLPSRAGDELLTPKQLEKISLFAQLGKKPSFAKFPGTVILRQYAAGEPIVRQGAAGWTAFYILKTEDVLELRRGQLTAAEQQLETGQGAESSPAWRSRLEQRIVAQRDDVAHLERGLAAIEKDTRQRQAATAHLLVDLSAKASRPGIFGRIGRALFGGTTEDALPRYIPNDGPADISLATRRAPMHEGELFGEMSCMSRAPRSATVVADRDCYLLEMLRNILDQVRKDPGYKEQMDRIYRERVLGGQLRKLSIFDQLSDEQFARLREHVELLTVEPGEVIFDEHDPADSFYVIRSGLVKVIKNLHYLMRPEDFSPAGVTTLCQELSSYADAAGALGAAWRMLPAPIQERIRSLAAAKTIDAKVIDVTAKAEVIAALNALVKGRQLPESLGKKKAELTAALDDPVADAVLAELPDKVEDWSDMDVREFNRLIVESMCPTGISRRRLSLGNRRTLAYLGRGDFFGEAGVIEGAPRGATCIGYNHPDSGQEVGGGAGITPARVELVRIGRDAFLEICRSSPKLAARIQAEVAARRKQSQQLVEQKPWDEQQPVMLNPRFEELGLIQGQKLMLIDLDRCTRCGDCVRACVNTHADGASRLYLDGPRFGKYLVPNACRKCLDPVCMIGCPVGSILRGNDGEIVIREWCIGCQLCADQCPYGSIHMNLLEDLKHHRAVGQPADAPIALGEETETKEVTVRAVVCDLCSSLASKEPACVYHCPHDAAMRIDARYEFPSG